MAVPLHVLRNALTALQELLAEREVAMADRYENLRQRAVGTSHELSRILANETVRRG